jgi:hypothetical protein
MLELAPGRHLVSVRVDNDYLVNVGWNVSSVTDHTQTNWNGMIGELSLRALEPVSIVRLLLCAMGIESDLAHRPVARQLRRSLLTYAASPVFAPKDELT